jgi:hypothetical protein
MNFPAFRNMMLSSALILISTLAKAEMPMQVWNQVQQQLARNQGLIAYRIDSAFELTGDAPPEVGQYATRVRQFDKNGKPVRELIASSKEATQAYRMDAMSLSLGNLAANRPEEFLLSPSSILFVRDETVDGLAASVYEAKTSVGKYPAVVMIWVMQKDATPIKMEGVLEKLPLPGIKKVQFVLRYATGLHGLTLPASMQINYAVSIFFQEGKVSFSQKFSDWEKR